MSLSRLLARCPRLSHIEMAGVDVPADFTCALLKAVSRLKYIDFSFCKGVKPSDINAIIERFPTVEIHAFGLDLAGVEQGDSALLIF